ncbi:HAD-IB family phosphatase [Chloroflexota bacterium]
MSNYLIQCDFDGTITEEDVSFLIFDVLGNRDGWHRLMDEYKAERITVGEFNRRAFAEVKTTPEELTDLVLKSGRVQIKPGFIELITFCIKNDVGFAIVSNGCDIYIDTILTDLGLKDIEFHAATGKLLADTIAVQYIGPEGEMLEKGFKDAYARQYLARGHRLIYIGNGVSDFPAAEMAEQIFATADLADCCREKGVAFRPFTDMYDVVRGLEEILASEK